jgi:hypothetical protein
VLVIRARQAPSIAAYTYYPLESTATLLLPSPPVERAGYSTFLQYLQVKRRADERTRTADLLITSVRSVVAERCLGLQILHR